VRRLFVLLVTLTLAACSRVGSGKHLALAGRLITIEQWQHPEGLAWAIADHKLTVYRMYDYLGRRDEIVFTRTISESDWQDILGAITAIPREYMGKHLDAFFSTGAPLLRITQSDDGTMSRKLSVEFAGFVPSWSTNVISVVSKIASPEAPITYTEAVRKYRLRWDPKGESSKFYSKSLDEYYGTKSE